MTLQDNPIVVLTTCPDPVTAEEIAGKLVEAGLAACVNVLAEMTSVYRWQGEIETSTESLLLIKSSLAVYEQLEAFIVDHHPYELPEIIALPISAGLPGYLAWMQENLHVRAG